VKYFSWLVVPPFDHPVFLPQIIPPVPFRSTKVLTTRLIKIFHSSLISVSPFHFTRKKFSHPVIFVIV